MKRETHLVVVSALAMAIALAGCDSGPRPPKSQGLQDQATSSAAATSTETRESSGTTAAEPPGSERQAVADLTNVHFDLDQAKIRPGDGRRLQEHARWLKSRRNTMVMIGGHADERGTDEHNMKLAERRANAVRSYLIAQGVESDRLAITSHGERNPACSDHNERCWGQNRRADFQVTSR